VWPIYPASSPYVTAVGATSLLDPTNGDNKQRATSPFSGQDASPICSQIYCSNGTVEATAMPDNAAFTSGGGFSFLFKQPSYQTAAVTAWMNSVNSSCTPPQGKWHSAGRGYPDVAAVGEEIYIVNGGAPQFSGGTSASTPIVAGIVALLNDWRLNNGKAPLGFLNPVLYDMFASNPQSFNDITLGHNACTAFGEDSPCCTTPFLAGYCAIPGWDPATGLGSPNYQMWLSYIQTLQ